MRVVRIGNGKAEKEAGYFAVEQDRATYVISVNANGLGLSDRKYFRYVRNKGLCNCPFVRVFMQFAAHTSCVS